MPKYKVIEGFEQDGTSYEADAIVELTEEVAAPLIESGKVEVAEEATE